MKILIGLLLFATIIGVGTKCGSDSNVAPTDTQQYFTTTPSGHIIDESNTANIERKELPISVVIDETGEKSSEIFIFMSESDFKKWLQMHDFNYSISQEGDIDGGENVTIYSSIGISACVWNDPYEQKAYIGGMTFDNEIFSTQSGLRCGDNYSKMIKLYGIDYNEERLYLPHDSTEYYASEYKYVMADLVLLIRMNKDNTISHLTVRERVDELDSMK
jgi:hypothetical protein